MKTFIFKTESKKSSYGNNVTMTVYRVKNNNPELIGQHFYNTGSMKGHVSECFTFLRNNNLISKPLYKKYGGYYIWKFEEQGILRIKEV